MSRGTTTSSRCGYTRVIARAPRTTSISITAVSALTTSAPLADGAPASSPSATIAASTALTTGLSENRKAKQSLHRTCQIRQRKHAGGRRVWRALWRRHPRRRRPSAPLEADGEPQRKPLVEARLAQGGPVAGERHLGQEAGRGVGVGGNGKGEESIVCGAQSSLTPGSVSCARAGAGRQQPQQFAFWLTTAPIHARRLRGGV